MARASFSLALLFLPFASALVLNSNTWGAPDSVHALDGVITAINSIVNNPHLSPEHLKDAKKVAEDIKLDIEAVEAGNLTKQQTKIKIGAALHELSAFGADFALKKEVVTANDARLSALKKDLADKQKELQKMESMMKLLKLKKALAEKKLQLEKLIMKKSEGKGGHKAEQDMAESSAVVSKLLSMAKNISGKDAGQFKTIVATLQAREHVVSESLARIVAEQAQGDAQIDTLMKAEMAKEGQQIDAKQKKMIKHLKAEENRKFAKARALKQNELNELKDAEKSTEARDVGALTKKLSKMQHESRQMQAKSGDFLH